MGLNLLYVFEKLLPEIEENNLDDISKNLAWSIRWHFEFGDITKDQTNNMLGKLGYLESPKIDFLLSQQRVNDNKFFNQILKVDYPIECNQFFANKLLSNDEECFKQALNLILMGFDADVDFVAKIINGSKTSTEQVWQISDVLEWLYQNRPDFKEKAITILTKVGLYDCREELLSNGYPLKNKQLFYSAICKMRDQIITLQNQLKSKDEIISTLEDEISCLKLSSTSTTINDSNAQLMSFFFRT